MVRFERVPRHDGLRLGFERFTYFRMARPPYHAVSQGKVAICGQRLRTVTDLPWADYVRESDRACATCVQLTGSSE